MHGRAQPHVTLRVLGAMIATLLFAACEHLPTDAPVAVPASIVVSPTPITLAPGGGQLFTAVVRDVYGTVIPVLPNWSVSTGGSISGTGQFTAGAVAGTFTNTVTASVGSLAGTATVIVTAGSLASITITPNPQVLAISGPQLFTATARDANGNVIALAPTWSVVAGGGSITAGGLFTAGTVAGLFANM